MASSPPRRGTASAAAVRIAGVEHLSTVARLALVEIQHRSAAPMFAPPHAPPLADLAAEHRALHDNGAVHLVATLDGRDVGLLTIELTSPVPRLCPDGQPYIGPTATLPAARGRGVGHALVDAALTWAYDHGYQWISVDFDTANPLSRPFWLNASSTRPDTASCVSSTAALWVSPQCVGIVRRQLTTDHCGY